MPTTISHAVESHPEPLPEPPLAQLYRAGANAALAVIALLVLQAIVFLLWPPPAFAPTPANARAWFALFDASPVVALANLDVLMLADFVLVVIVFLALWSALRREQPALSLVGLVLVALSAAAYLASNPSFTLLSLSHGYRDAMGLDREHYVAAGQAALAAYHGTPFDVGYVLSAIAGIVMCTAMLRSRVFSAPIAALGLVMYTMGLVPPTVGPIGMLLSVASLPLLALWLFLVARRLLELGRPDASA